MKKRLLAVLLAGAMVLSITACGSSKDSSKSTTEAAKKRQQRLHLQLQPALKNVIQKN